ncbi:MAG: AAA family ATPase [Planctomycetes bacterium]|nr:AAA family ATPase [Planctomycetota bacterium]
MSYADVDEVLDDHTNLVLALDQSPFEVQTAVGVNKFAVLVPLMTEDGRRFENLERDFPNRGRVWWMLRPENERESLGPGSLWTAPIERAPEFGSSHPKKDFYQIVRPRAFGGVKDWVEILEVPFDPADAAAALPDDGIRMERPPLPLVVLLGRGRLVGPYHARWDAATGHAILAAANPGKPQAFALPVSALRPGEHFEEFTYRTNRWDPRAPQRDLTIRLLAKKHLEAFPRAGQVLDAASDNQVVNWALGRAQFTKAERSVFRDAISRLPGGPETEGEFPGRLARFKSLCERGERVRALGVEVAQSLAAQPAFAALVQNHASTLAEARIAELVASRSAELEEALQQATNRFKKLQEDLGRLEREYDQAKSEQEARLEIDRADWIRSLERREAELAERQASIEKREREMESRLADVVHRYETQGRELGNELLAQVPILRRLGLGGSGGGEGGRDAPPDVPARLALPLWLGHPRRKGNLDEAAFLSQFADVAARRGYVFDREDLVNFHLSVKVGFWTVLAGPSGTGKTSLPRLYAEALGSLDEYVSIPVRPDWLDDRDLIGAFNALAGRFEPAATGLVDRLIAAAKDLEQARGGIYVVCLDEMNLARVEHYCAQLLSVIEEPPARRRLQLFSRGVERTGEPYSEHRELSLGDNLRFVGTINMDETTHFFSPKVLDRAPVLCLEAPAIDREPAPRAKAQVLDVTPVHFEEYGSWIRGPEQAAPEVRTLLVSLDRHLRNTGSGLGFRMRDRVLAYVASSRGLLSPARALDLALAQNVLPRLRTGHAGFKEAIQGIVELVPEASYPRSGRLLTALRDAGGDYDFFQLL